MLAPRSMRGGQGGTPCHPPPPAPGTKDTGLGRKSPQCAWPHHAGFWTSLDRPLGIPGAGGLQAWSETPPPGEAHASLTVDNPEQREPGQQRCRLRNIPKDEPPPVRPHAGELPSSPENAGAVRAPRRTAHFLGGSCYRTGGSPAEAPARSSPCSLVTCPIALYPASSQAEKTHFHQINRTTEHRLRQQMVDEETGKVVEKDDKSRGYEISKGKYVEIEPEEIKAIQVESTHTLDIDKFVPVDEIDRRYCERPYYIVPESKAGEEAFAVIREAMKDKGRVALAEIVLTNREHVMAIEPMGKIMLGTILRYDYEVRDEKELSRSVPSPRIPKEMLSLASHILDAKAGHFDRRNSRTSLRTSSRSC